MTIVLVTTSHNTVRDCLERLPDISLHTVDCHDDYATIGERLARAVAEHSPDVIISYRCPYIIPRAVYMSARMGAYNIHPSLLPAYAGLNPWDEIFKNRETAGGVTLHRITERVDGGEIIYQHSFVINPDNPVETARHESDVIAAQLACQLLNSISEI